MIKLAIVSPCYNEEEVLEESTTRLTALFDDLVAKKKISADSFVLFVNDGSKDRTWSIIKQLHRTNPYIKGMNLARNVGHQYAIMAGMMTAKDWRTQLSGKHTAANVGSNGKKCWRENVPSTRLVPGCRMKQWKPFRNTW